MRRSAILAAKNLFLARALRPVAFRAARVMALGFAAVPIFASLAAAECSYDLNGVGYGDNCPYRGGGGYVYRPPIYRPPPVYYPPPPPPPSPAQIRAQQMAIAAHNDNQTGVAAFNRKDWAAALADFERALALSPADPVIRRNVHNAQIALAVQTNNIAIAAQKRGDLAGAVAGLRRALELDPTDVKIKTNLQSALSILQQRRAIDDSRPGIVAALDAPSTGSGAASAAPAALDFMSGAPSAVDPIASVAPPSPSLDSLKWSASFPGQDAPAGVSLSQSEIDKLSAAPEAGREWLGQKLIDAAKGKARDTGIGAAIKALPLSDALKNEARWQQGMVDRYKQLFQDVNKDTQNYILGFAKVTNAAASCMGSAALNCDSERADVEVVSNRYANQSSDRWKSWVKTDIKARLSGFFGGSKP